jgi:hypothetical protein
MSGTSGVEACAKDAPANSAKTQGRDALTDGERFEVTMVSSARIFDLTM